MGRGLVGPCQRRGRGLVRRGRPRGRGRGGAGGPEGLGVRGERSGAAAGPAGALAGLGLAAGRQELPVGPGRGGQRPGPRRPRIQLPEIIPRRANSQERGDRALTAPKWFWGGLGPLRWRERGEAARARYRKPSTENARFACTGSLEKKTIVLKETFLCFRRQNVMCVWEQTGM